MDGFVSLPAMRSGYECLLCLGSLGGIYEHCSAAFDGDLRGTSNHETWFDGLHNWELLLALFSSLGTALFVYYDTTPFCTYYVAFS